MEGGRQQVIDVVVRQPDIAVEAVVLRRQLLQQGPVQPWDDELAAVILKKAALLHGDRPALLGADAQNRKGVFGAADKLRDRGQIRLADLVGDQQEPPLADGGILQELQRLFDRRRRVAAVTGHDRRRQGRGHAADGSGVVGERRDHVGVARIDHQGGGSFLAGVEDVAEFLQGAGEAVGGEILGVEGKREILNDHQRIHFLSYGLGRFFPHRSGNGDAGHQPGRQQRQQRPPCASGGRVRQQMPQQGGIDGPMPVAGFCLRPPEQDEQQQCRQAAPEPEGAQKMKIGGIETVHRAAPLWRMLSSRVSAGQARANRRLVTRAMANGQ